ncbi:MAG: hypothetical protein ACREJO_13510 [Phycisphaerales bacterium]
MIQLHVCATCALLLTAAGACLGQPIGYQVIDLGTLGGTGARAWEVNSGNQVAGESTLQNGQSRGFMWDGAIHNLEDARGFFVYALSINDAGAIVGTGVVDGQSGLFLRSGGQWTNLGSLGGGGDGAARAVNNSAQAAGWSRNASGRTRAFLYDGTMHDLSTLGLPQSEAFGLNDHGDVVGFSQTAGGLRHAWLWAGGNPMDLSASFAGNSVAYGVNQSLVVVGEGVTSGTAYRGFRWQNGTTAIIGTLGGNYSALLDVNDSGVAVGIASITDGTNHAIIHEPTYGLVDLNTLALNGTGLTLREAWSINQSGAIAGYAEDASHRGHAFLAIPIPVPGSATALAMSMLVASRRRR